MVRLLVGWRANVNLQARANDLPLSCAVRQQRPEMVRCLLELRANPTVTCYSPTNARSVTRWVRITVKELAEPASEIALFEAGCGETMRPEKSEYFDR